MKPGLEAPPLKECNRGFIAHSKHFTHLQGKAVEKPVSRAAYVAFYLTKGNDKQEKQVTHTYNLIGAKIFIEATK